LKEKSFDEEDKQTLSTLIESSNFMSDTLNDVLSMTKIEEGAMTLTIKPFGLSKMLQRVVSTFMKQAESKSIEILFEANIEKDTESYNVKGDQFRIEHVTANLLSNAIKFSPENSQIVVRVNSEDLKNTTISESHRMFVISVSDSGVGINAEGLKKIFTPYHQIRSDELQQGGGTGLGLSLAKHMIELHGGILSCESKEGVGTTFMIRIPMEICDLQNYFSVNETPRVFDRDKFEEAFDLSSLHALVVDGNLLSYLLLIYYIVSNFKYIIIRYNIE
jgi:signal transduction histidine kinase